MDSASAPANTRQDQPDQTEKTPYEMIGGEAGVRKLVERFYDIMESDPGAAGVRAMHAKDITPMRNILFEFLSGAFGGPPLYMQRPDAKCVISAHAHFAIGVGEIEQWMMCMRGALDESVLPAGSRRLFEEGFQGMADAMCNR